MSMQIRQQGGSTIGLVIFLAIFAYGVFVGLQYVPQWIESNTVTTILDSIVEKNSKQRFGDGSAVRSAIERQLSVNTMDDLMSSFKVTQYRGKFIIKVSYERELNLLYETKLMPFEKTVTLE
jgi:hypothetical protein